MIKYKHAGLNSVSAAALKVLVFLFLLTTHCASAQDLSSLKLEQYDEENGLLSRWITGMVQDKSGHLWIAGVEGLNRFDGHRFVSFTHSDKDSSSLLSNEVHSMALDARGSVWIAYKNGGFSKYEESCGCFRHFRYDVKGDPQRQVGAIYLLEVQGDSVVWYSGISKGLNRLHLKTGKHEHFDLPLIDSSTEQSFVQLRNTVNQILRENRDSVWLASGNGLYIFAYPGRRFTLIKADSSNASSSLENTFVRIFPEGKTGLWLYGNHGGLTFYNRQDGRFDTYPYDLKNKDKKFSNEIDAIAIKNQHEFWISSEDSGVGVFNKQTRTYLFPESIAKQTGELTTRKARILYTTSDSVLFVVNNYGIVKLAPDRKLFDFKLLPLGPGQDADHYMISDIVEDTASGLVYFATMLANGLNILNIHTGKFSAISVEPNPNKSSNYQLVRRIITDRSNNVWILSPYFLYRLDKETMKLDKVLSSDLIPGRRTNEYFADLIPDGRDAYWMVTNRHGVHRFSITRRQVDSSLTRQLGEVSNVCVDASGKLWFSTDSGLYSYEENKGVQRFSHQATDTLVTRGIFDLVVDKVNNLWLGINDLGVFCLIQGTNGTYNLKQVRPSAGLPSQKLYSFGLDEVGNVWLATKKGMVLFRPDSGASTLFNRSTGMPKDMMGMKYINAGSGAFYIVSGGKYCRVNKSSVSGSLPVPDVFIDNVSVLNAARSFDATGRTPLVLKPGENIFSIEFGCIDFVSQTNVQFAYKLEGWDDDWVYCGDRRFASYTNLNGGEYTFLVKVANSVGKWGDPVSVPIVIEIPFYKRSWFVALMVLVFSSLAYAVYRMRINQIEQTEKLKTEFNRKLNETKLMALRAQMNPHFIFNSLNSINRYVIKSEVRLASYYITKFSKLMRLILDNSEHKRVVLSNELEALKLYIEMEALRFDNKFTFEIVVDDSVAADRIDVPPLLIQPYVENAIWHGLMHRDDNEGRLVISLTSVDDLLVCEITDNGVGREKAMEYKSKSAPTRKSVGMKLTEERLAMREEEEGVIGSQQVIDLKDEAGSPLGTKVIIKIPI